MTDLEITRLCAEAMNLDIVGLDKQYCRTDSLTETREYVLRENPFYSYNPLVEDDQAMALVKKIKIDTAYTAGKWHAEIIYTTDDKMLSDQAVISKDLNRAICECVAKMQKAKNERS